MIDCRHGLASKSSPDQTCGDQAGSGGSTFWVLPQKARAQAEVIEAEGILSGSCSGSDNSCSAKALTGILALRVTSTGPCHVVIGTASASGACSPAVLMPVSDSGRLRKGAQQGSHIKAVCWSS